MKREKDSRIKQYCLWRLWAVVYSRSTWSVVFIRSEESARKKTKKSNRVTRYRENAAHVFLLAHFVPSLSSIPFTQYGEPVESNSLQFSFAEATNVYISTLCSHACRKLRVIFKNTFDLFSNYLFPSSYVWAVCVTQLGSSVAKLLGLL